MKPKTLAQGALVIAELARELEAGAGPFSRQYAGAILAAAKARAAKRPTPQAPMVAEHMRLVGKPPAGARIIGPKAKKTHTGARLGAVAFGAEYGSIKPNSSFGPRNEGGQWLHPAANTPDPAMTAIRDAFLPDLLRRVIP